MFFVCGLNGEWRDTRDITGFWASRVDSRPRLFIVFILLLPSGKLTDSLLTVTIAKRLSKWIIAGNHVMGAIGVRDMFM